MLDVRLCDLHLGSALNKSKTHFCLSQPLISFPDDFLWVRGMLIDRIIDTRV